MRKPVYRKTKKLEWAQTSNSKRANPKLPKVNKKPTKSYPKLTTICGVSINITPGPTRPHRDPQGPTRLPSPTNPSEPSTAGFLNLFMQGPLNKLFEVRKPCPTWAPPEPTGPSPSGLLRPHRPPEGY